ncbi:MAG: hypothetical protein JOZ10_03970 [Acidobacteria bacterium]|nr:hypothetical protein [Acidobacteriota bacterium]MBV9437789.1 hypothetical protein [Acidobacteriota bacterium]
MRFVRTTAVIAAFAVGIAVEAGGQASQNPPVNRDSAISADFSKRVGDYMKLRQKAQSGLIAPKNTASAQQIAAYQHQLAAKIRDLRPNAAPGDIFTPEIATLFHHLVRQAMNSPDGEKIRKSYTRAEPVHGIRLDVNQAYPDGIPLQSMPPSLLLNLPQLPKELEYRFVGRELVLRDIAANLIVDVLPNITTPDGSS